MPDERQCSVDGCKNAYRCRGVCRTHYHRLWKYGDVSANSRNGRSKHPLYRAWAGMVNRCSNPNNSSYHQYGGRGIYVCERWRKFDNFLADMGERPDGMTLDRIDPKGPYAPENCRWATAAEQRSNLSPEGVERHRSAVRASALKHWGFAGNRAEASARMSEVWAKRRAAK